jgi:uncharacterized protein (DUF934 family)
MSVPSRAEGEHRSAGHADATVGTPAFEFIMAESDPWTAVPPEQPVEPQPHLLLGWTQWCELRERWPDDLRAGVVFPNDADIKELLPSLPHLALVALSFPKWTDGRAYSQARLLRTRHRYGGQLRAVGDVIPDMAAQLQRTGFDSAMLRAGESIAVARRMLTFFPEFYQADVNERRIRFERTGTAGITPT